MEPSPFYHGPVPSLLKMAGSAFDGYFSVMKFPLALQVRNSIVQNFKKISKIRIK